MKKIAFYFILIALVLCIPFYIYWFINIAVSRKYEADDGCISNVDGTNLCNLQIWVAILFFLSIIILLSLIIFRKKLIG